MWEKLEDIRFRGAPLVNYIVPLITAIWYTVLCGGFAYIYWVIGWHDPRNIFGSALSDIGAILVFPVGWIGLLLSIDV